MLQKDLVVPIEVRFRDLDNYGHVNNAVYLTYFEVARTKFYMRIMGMESLDQLDFIIAEASCTYRSPAMFEDHLLVRVWLSEVGTTSFVFNYDVTERNSGRLIATGRTVQVAYDYQTKTKRQAPDRLRELLR